MKAIIEPTASSPLPQPTDVLPGPAKVEVMAQRYADGCFIWHPDDATGGTSEPHRQGQGRRMRDREGRRLYKLPESLIDRLGDHAHKLMDNTGPRR